VVSLPGTPATLAGRGGRLAVVYQVASCGSRSDFLLVHVSLVCMYALSPPPLHTSYFLYFILSLTSLLTHPTLTLTSLHSPSLTPHTPHTDTENVFRLMVWVLDVRQRKQLHPLTPSHPHILTESKAGVDMVSHLYYDSPLLCVWDICMRHLSVVFPE